MSVNGIVIFFFRVFASCRVFHAGANNARASDARAPMHNRSAIHFTVTAISARNRMAIATFAESGRG